jgi:glutamine cyclotransferase
MPESTPTEPPPSPPPPSSAKTPRLGLAIGALLILLLLTLGWVWLSGQGTPDGAGDAFDAALPTPGTAAGAMDPAAISGTPPATPGVEEYQEPALPTTAAGSTPEQLKVKVLSKHPHDPSAFTQGLLLKDGELYESTGLEGRSSLRRVDPATGEVRQQIEVPAEFFAEGLARVEDRLLQLTWQDGVAFEYDQESFEKQGEFKYDTEGWGLCYDGQRLVMSDGTSTLFFRDPDTFERIGEVPVTLAGAPQAMLNELECVGNQVYANVWQTDTIVRIDPSTGAVGAVIDASGLLTPEERSRADVLNGIAWDPARGTYIITGKLWPWLYEVQFEPK